ncbi:Uncharacterised protein [Mycobacteroides abscessus subsp. abscessus]|nr:Uncharacterised protein [Mycobacteroides abscessus subsp. abscessus]
MNSGTSSTPGQSGTTARPPTFRKILSAEMISSPTESSVGDRKLACSW